MKKLISVLLIRHGWNNAIVSVTDFVILQFVRISPLLGRQRGNTLLKLIRLTAKFVPYGYAKSILLAFDKMACLEGHPLASLVKQALRRQNPRYLRSELFTFFIRYFWYGCDRRDGFRNKGTWVPTTYVISPTMRCNLRCKGCYAACYDKKDELEFEVIDRVVKEGKDLGIYNVYISGGEPFLREDMLDIYRRHNDVFFQVFTNGTLIDASLSRELARLGNVVPLISLEGFEEETDSWRGRGTFQKIMAAMDNLRENGVPFGCSIVVTRFNIDTILSDEFNDMLVEKGCLLGWQFLYSPVGHPPSLELMPTPEQRLRMKRRGAEHIRTNKKIFMVDNHDIIYTNGCYAGGRHFFHINSRGDVEPCVFIPFAVDNVHEKSLREVLESPFLKAFRARQPYGKNLLCSCAVLDHVEVIREIVNEFHPYPTYPGAEALVNEFYQPLIQYAKEVAKLMDPVWEEEYQGYKCNSFVSLLERSAELYQRSSTPP